MSSLSYICDYGSNSSTEESDCEIEIPCAKRRKLPTPDLSKVSVIPFEEHEDEPVLHEGRKRSFLHVRGNWATFVYIPVPGDILIDLVINLKNFLYNQETLHQCEDFHISVSKTVVLKYHQIKLFSSSLSSDFCDIESFELCFDAVKIYCNEEKTRTFIALEVDQLSASYLQKISEKVDNILEDFKLPTFYKDPSFHVSVLWINGDKEKYLNNILDKLNDIVQTEIEKLPVTCSVTTVNCKTGNKQFLYALK